MQPQALVFNQGSGVVFPARPRTIEELYAREWTTVELLGFHSFAAQPLEKMVFCEANLIAFYANQGLDGNQFKNVIFYQPVKMMRDHLIKHWLSLGPRGLEHFFGLHQGAHVKNLLGVQFCELVYSMSHPLQPTFLREAMLREAMPQH